MQYLLTGAVLLVLGFVLFRSGLRLYRENYSVAAHMRRWEAQREQLRREALARAVVPQVYRTYPISSVADTLPTYDQYLAEIHAAREANRLDQEDAGHGYGDN